MTIKRLIACAFVALPALGVYAPGDAHADSPPNGGTAPVPATATSSPASSTPTSSPPGASSGSHAPLASPPATTAAQDPAALVATGPVTVRMRPAALLGNTLNFHGRTRPAYHGATISIQRYDALRAAWVQATSAVVGARGQFLARWRTNLVGRIRVRAALAAAQAAGRARRPRSDQSSTTAEITVYRPAVATYFGPGFYGRHTACGQTMSATLVGVASRTLACGTLVQIDYAGRRLTAPVVDRGPYANGATWDLTYATAQALGMTATETIGTIVSASAASESSGSPFASGAPSASSPPSGTGAAASSSGGARSSG